VELLKAQHAKEKADLEKSIERIVNQRIAASAAVSEAQIKRLQDDNERLQQRAESVDKEKARVESDRSDLDRRNQILRERVSNATIVLYCHVATIVYGDHCVRHVTRGAALQVHTLEDVKASAEAAIAKLEMKLQMGPSRCVWPRSTSCLVANQILSICS